MNVLEAVAGKMRLGWDSPVSEVVNPAFIELNGRGGLGWLKGFNELVTRCGYEWVGHILEGPRWGPACAEAFL